MYVDIPDKEMGMIRVSVRRNASRITARFAAGRMLVIVPPGLTNDQILKAVGDLKEKMLVHRPARLFELGRDLELDGGFRFSFEPDKFAPTSVRAQLADDTRHVRILVGTSLDIADAQTVGMISRTMLRAARVIGACHLMERTAQIAAHFGLRITEIDISRGARTLGHCSSRGKISISCACLFLSAPLRDYIICHELAHLTHFDHSAAFHALCDRYCNGREADLIKALKNYNWPILR